MIRRLISAGLSISMLFGAMAVTGCSKKTQKGGKKIAYRISPGRSHIASPAVSLRLRTVSRRGQRPRIRHSTSADGRVPSSRSPAGGRRNTPQSPYALPSFPPSGFSPPSGRGPFGLPIPGPPNGLPITSLYSVLRASTCDFCASVSSSCCAIRSVVCSGA